MPQEELQNNFHEQFLLKQEFVCRNILMQQLVQLK